MQLIARRCNVTDVDLRKLQRTGCDVRTDRSTRILFATDASIYQMEPQAAAFPRSAEEASAVLARESMPGFLLRRVAWHQPGR